MTIEICVSFQGVQAVRIYGKDWEDGAPAYSLLQRLSPLIRQLDSLAKQEEMASISPSLKTGFTQ